MTGTPLSSRKSAWTGSGVNEMTVVASIETPPEIESTVMRTVCVGSTQETPIQEFTPFSSLYAF